MYLLSTRYPKLRPLLLAAAAVLIVLEVVWGGDRGCDRSLM